MPLTGLFLCMHPIAQGIASGLVLAAIIHLVLMRIRRTGLYRTPVLAYGSLLLLTLWLGSYSVSPLGFSSGRIPLLRGFLVTRSHGVSLGIASHQTISVGSNSIIEIEPDTLSGQVRCIWSSTTGGVFDDPNSCDTAFVAGQNAQFDVLRVSVRSECQLPSSVGDIKVAILP